MKTEIGKNQIILVLHIKTRVFQMQMKYMCVNNYMRLKILKIQSPPLSLGWSKKKTKYDCIYFFSSYFHLLGPYNNSLMFTLRYVHRFEDCHYTISTRSTQKNPKNLVFHLKAHQESYPLTQLLCTQFQIEGSSNHRLYLNLGPPHHLNIGLVLVPSTSTRQLFLEPPQEDIAQAALDGFGSSGRRF